MEKLMKMFAALCALLTIPVDERDEKALAKTLKETADFFGSDEGKALGEIDDRVKEIEQLKNDLAAEQEAVRQIQKSGLGVRGGGVVVPGGLRARRQMLADQRAFVDDETAKRFGAYMAFVGFDLNGRSGRCPAYVKDMAQEVIKDMDPGVDASGGYVIPDEFRAELIRNVEATGVFFPLARRLPLVTLGQVSIPKRTGGLTAYWTAPAAQGTASTPTFGLVTLTPQKLMALTVIPNEFERSALLIDLGNFIAMEMVYAMSYALDDALINGDGTAAYGSITGIMQSANISSVSAASGNTTIATLDPEDISNVIAGMTVDYGFRGPRWGLSLSVLMALRSLRNADDVPVFERANGQMPANIDGYPFTYGNRMVAAGSVSAATKYAWFGDLSISHIVGMLRDVEIAKSEHAYFLSDQAAIRGTMHVDMAEADVNAIVVAKTAAE